MIRNKNGQAKAKLSYKIMRLYFNLKIETSIILGAHVHENS